MIGKSEYQDINKLLNKRIEEKTTLIAVHRGSWGGNIIENTNAAYNMAFKMGADIVECDLTNSTDGEIYCFHDGGEPRVVAKSENMKTMSSKEIDSLTVYNSLGLVSCHKIQKLEELLEYYHGNELYNIDRAWDFLPLVHEKMQKYPDSVYHAIIKTPVKKEYLDFFQNCKTKYMYMPIAKNMEEVKEVLSYDGINLVGIEAIATTHDSEMIDPENIKWMREKGLFVWTNSITLGGLKEFVLCGGYDDDKAVLGDEDGAWGKLIKLGYNVLQTDWPAILRDYLKNNE